MGDINVCDINPVSEAFLEQKQPYLCHLQHSSAVSTGIREAQSPASAALKTSFVTVRKLNNTPLPAQLFFTTRLETDSR